MLTTLKDVLGHARANHYAVPAFDAVEDVMVRAMLETCEQLRAPAILMCLEQDIQGNGWAYTPGLIRAVANYHLIPVVLHLDHAIELDPIKRAVDCGFSSVMIDGSRLPFAENVAITRAAVEIARPHGISVEAELGYVGGMDLEDKQCFQSTLTEADEVARFVAETGVDALAVSIGTAHGVYRSEPVLNIERLKELHAASTVPLVLHGGSGTPDDQIRTAVCHGICKLNIYADNRIAMAAGLQESARSMKRKDPLPHELFGPIKAGVIRTVTEKLELLGAINRVDLAPAALAGRPTLRAASQGFG
jgi:fructose-bisphosphate aldolase, class II